ncbi:MAG: ABC transporter permease [Paludibaculum sp.]
MIVWREWWQRLRGSFGVQAKSSELEEELALHLAMLTDEYVAQGMAPAEAARAARLTLGGQDQIREAYRDQRGIPLLESFWQDLRYAVRTHRNNPGFSVVVLLTMALGIGVNTSVFSVLYSAWLAPMNYADPSALVDVSVKNLQNNWQTGGTAWANLSDWRAANQSFTGLGTYRIQRDASLTGLGEPQEMNLARVSSNLFPLLGVAPLLGRDFAQPDDRLEGNRSAMLSYGYWQTHFGGDPGVLGRSLAVDGESFTVIGVMPKGFAFPPGWPAVYQPPIWLSLNLPAEARTQRGPHSLYVVGRRKPGVTLRQAQVEMEAIVGRLAVAYPRENSGYGAWLSPLSETRQLRQVKPVLTLLMAAAGLVLLIACVNVANLLLVRGSARRREFAIRQAMGIPRTRLIRQVLTESAILGLLGGAAGLGVAWIGTTLIEALLPRSMPQMTEVRLHPAVLVFSILCSLVCGLLFGLAPAWNATRVSIEGALKQSARTIAPRSRLARALVVAEMALALVLLSAGGLLAESFRRVSNVNFGFDREHVLTLRATLPKRKYDTAAKILAFRRELLARATGLPKLVLLAVLVLVPSPRSSCDTHSNARRQASSEKSCWFTVPPLELTRDLHHRRIDLLLHVCTATNGDQARVEHCGPSLLRLRLIPRRSLSPLYVPLGESGGSSSALSRLGSSGTWRQQQSEARPEHAHRVLLRGEANMLEALGAHEQGHRRRLTAARFGGPAENRKAAVTDQVPGLLVPHEQRGQVGLDQRRVQRHHPLLRTTFSSGNALRKGVSQF